MVMGDKWWSEGTDDLDEIEKEEKRMKSGGTRRVWMPVGKTFDGGLLDDEPFRCWEHQVKINGDWKNWFTCRAKNKGLGDSCALCDDGHRPNFMSFLTVVDTVGYVGKSDGKTYGVGRRMLLPMRMDALRKFTRKKDAAGALAGRKIKIFRDKDKEQISDMEIGPEMEAEDYKNPVDNTTWRPINYVEELAPLEPAALARIARSCAPAGNRGKKDEGDKKPEGARRPADDLPDDEDIPF